jgi:hypothetical protein
VHLLKRSVRAGGERAGSRIPLGAVLDPRQARVRLEQLLGDPRADAQGVGKCY